MDSSPGDKHHHCVACEHIPGWMSIVLFAAGVYNLLWGAAVILLPAWTLGLIGLDGGDAHLRSLWGCIGMIVGVYGVGYLAAARDPIRHWPIVLVGLLGKVLGPIGFVQGWVTGVLPGQMAWTILTNDLIWWVPFTVILWSAVRQNQGSDEPVVPDSSDALAGRLSASITRSGDTLAELSAGPGLVLVFIRHLGCTFCRQMLDDLSRERPALEAAGLNIAIVHQSEDGPARDLFARYGLDDVPRYGDPDRLLYRAFGLQRGSFLQLFGPRVVAAGVKAVNHGVGRLQGDGFQMPGVFLVRDARVVEAVTFEHAGQRVDFTRFAGPSPQEPESSLNPPQPTSTSASPATVETAS